MKQEKGQENMKRYFRAPIYLIILFILGDMVLYSKNVVYGIIGSGVIVIYGLLVWSYYHVVQTKIQDELVRYAIHYQSVQQELLDSFDVAYALMDEAGKLLWMNREFSEVAEKEQDYHKSITSIFKEITREVIDKSKEDVFQISVYYNERHYMAHLQRLNITPGEQDKEFAAMVGSNSTVITVMLFDHTEREHLRQDLQDQKLVAGLVYIDNYDEVLDSVEEVKKSLITAIIDRKINKYFQPADAIIRKLERDKFFIVFPQKYLAKLEEDKFSILEEIKTTKAGNELEITLSIGLGVGCSTYIQNAEYARAAIDLALGRGGSQAVVKSNSNVSYYGIRGKEIEKNTRVKARMKAQALREIMETKDQIIIMGHTIADVDSFGAAVGLFCAARELGKNARIVLNTITSSLRPLVDMFTPEAGYPEGMFVNSEQALGLVTGRTLVIVVDTNRPTYTDCPQLLDRTKSIVVFDHHRQGNQQVVNPILSYIEPYASSSCEMIAEVLQYFSEKIHLKPHEADCVYAGILIDTNNFMTKTGVRTFEAAAYLRRCGAEVTRVRKLLREDMSAYKARAEVVRNAEVYRGLFAFSVCESEQLESPTVVGAKAANELLNIVGIKASFVLTEYEHKIYVSSRSIDEIDVQLIMERLGGGGHLNMAGAQIENSSVEEVRANIQGILDVMIDEGEIKV
jgi:c-di-AMP phosphodiesterase-like protein